MEIAKQIKERLSIFKNLYDTLRLVDPVNHRALIIHNEVLKELEGTCYDFWQRGTLCDNCISMRAHLEKDTCVKLEFVDEKVYMIIATPVKLNNSEYILEILKDISKDSNMFKGNSENIQSINSLLKDMTDKMIKDELTGVYNRRYINERLPVDLNESNSTGLPLSVIMADIDLFKKVNDTYGHVIGDEVLKDFANIILESVKNEKGWVARYGGEEFLIVLQNTNEECAYELAENIRKTLEETSFDYRGTKISITSSFGVYSINDKKLVFNQLIANVDKNLYRAKQSGRNKTVR